jgi:hypothetical protein
MKFTEVDDDLSLGLPLGVPAALPHPQITGDLGLDVLRLPYYSV